MRSKRWTQPADAGVKVGAGGARRLISAPNSRN